MFLTIEGIDGAGKTTFAKKLVSKLKEQGVDVVHTREPGGTPSAELIRKVIIDTATNPLTDILLISAARVEHLKELIVPSLESGKIVICERFIDSTFAYQVTADTDANAYFTITDIFFNLESYINKTLPKNTVFKTFFLDITPEQSRERMVSNSKELDRFENDRDLQQRVYRSYKERISLDPSRFITIDATLTELEIESKINYYVDCIVRDL